MKPIKLLFTTLVIVLTFHVQSHSQVIKVGAGAELRSDPPVGMITKITYDLGVLDPNLRISLDAAVLPNFEANLDVHYTFLREFGVDAYALAGTNFASNIGFNAGAGVNLEISKSLDGFGEAKYLINDSPQASIKVGILYKL